MSLVCTRVSSACHSYELLCRPYVTRMYSYVTASLVCTRMSSVHQSTFSDYLNILFGVRQGSIAGPLFFNFYTCDMFFQIDTSEFSSNEDGNTPFTAEQNHEKLISSLKSILNGMFELYQKNYFKANADKCHLFVSPFSNKETTITNYNISSSNS